MQNVCDALTYKRHADEVAIQIMQLQDKLYYDCDNIELQQDIEDLEADYQYLRNKYEQLR